MKESLKKNQESGINVNNGNVLGGRIRLLALLAMLFASSFTVGKITKGVSLKSDEGNEDESGLSVGGDSDSERVNQRREKVLPKIVYVKPNCIPMPEKHILDKTDEIEADEVDKKVDEIADKLCVEDNESLDKIRESVEDGRILIWYGVDSRGNHMSEFKGDKYTNLMFIEPRNLTCEWPEPEEEEVAEEDESDAGQNNESI